MEKIIIIGAGVAGMTAGVYARLNGFEAEIYEMHTIPGGECTGWKRGGFYFDGCIHWLMGCNPGSPMNRIWRDMGALDDAVEIIRDEEFYRLEMGGRTAILYKDLDRLENHLLSLSPADETLIRELCEAARLLRRMEIPIDKPLDMMGALDGIKMMRKAGPALGTFGRFGKISIAEYAEKFKDPLLRQTFLSFMPVQYNVSTMLLNMASFSTGDSGYPRGGSLPMAKRMEKRFTALGGKIYYKSRVEEIVVEGGRAVGVRLADGTVHRADWVVSAADGYATLHRMLGGRYRLEGMEKQFEDRERYPVCTTVQVSMGIGADLSHEPHRLYVPLDRPIDAGGNVLDHILLKNYCFDPTMVPQGKAVVTSLLPADFDWWKAKKEDPAAYQAEKERIAREVCAVLESRYPEAKGKIEQVDVSTPMTYVRYCDAWRGSWMSFMTTPKGKTGYISGKLPGLDRFYMAGQWTMAPGGLPGAAMAGRWVIQRLCKLNKRKFIAQ